MKIDTLKKKKIGFVSFGCGKNLVELEKIIAKCSSSGMKIVNNAEDANILLINSCAFLKSTRQEDFDTIKEFQDFRKKNLEKLIVTGCLAGYKLDNISQHLQGVDLILPQEKNENIVNEIAKLYGVELSCEFDRYDRVVTTGNYAYLRIADGCDSFCSYCTIPYITGRYKSIPFEDLVKEANVLADKGISELIFVAQDITIYGKDLYGKERLVELVQEISKIEGIKKIRLIYCYPEHITDELIDEIARNDKVCKYIDIPLQHISNNILKKMNRRNTKENTINLITKLRKKVKDIQIRTTFILGFPGETENDFNELCEFVKKYKLNQVGFFAYSREKGTIAYNLKPQISQKVKNQRVKTLAKLQYENVKQNNIDLIGKEFDAIVDSVGKDYYIFRTDFQLPNLDNITIVYAPELAIGEYYKVRIVGSIGYDLVAEIVKPID